jgi:hypothetical protein
MKFAVLLTLMGFVSIVEGQSVEYDMEADTEDSNLVEIPGVQMPNMGQEMVDFINNDDSIPFMVLD